MYQANVLNSLFCNQQAVNGQGGACYEAISNMIRTSLHL